MKDDARYVNTVPWPALMFFSGSSYYCLASNEIFNLDKTNLPIGVEIVMKFKRNDIETE